MDRRARKLAERLQVRGWQLAVAESLTGGLLSAGAARGPDAGKWFRGGIVAYQPEIKFDLLKVPEGPVVSKICATEMARGVRELLHADVGIAVTGVGGPEPEEDVEPGTVWVAVSTPERETSELARFAGRPPPEVCELSCVFALDLAIKVL